jgi:hypothetical protein
LGQINLVFPLLSKCAAGTVPAGNQQYSLRNAQAEVSTQPYARTGSKIREVFFLSAVVCFGGAISITQYHCQRYGASQWAAAAAVKYRRTRRWARDILVRIESNAFTNTFSETKQKRRNSSYDGNISNTKNG